MGKTAEGLNRERVQAMTRVFVAGIFHETHSFSGDTTGLEGFVIHRGQQILDRRGDASQVDGFLSVAQREGWEVVPSAVYTGGASGTVDDAVFVHRRQGGGCRHAQFD